VDAATHEGALQAAELTVGVLGCSIAGHIFRAAGCLPIEIVNDEIVNDEETLM
jgi:predicted Rossmann fold nucleotide-binding protein DprA/Smf involved in DNA uptake